MNAGEVVASAKALLSDTNQRVEHWTEPELLLWVAEGQKRIALQIPVTTSRTVRYQVVAGSGQTMPSQWRVILSVHDLLDSQNRRIAELHRISADDADRGTPGWRGEVGTPCEYIMYDYATNPRRGFFLLPGAAATGLWQVELVVSVVPEAVTDSAQVLVLNDEWEPALVDYVMYRALMRQQKEGNLQVAGAYMQSFTNAIASARPENG